MTAEPLPDDGAGQGTGTGEPASPVERALSALTPRRERTRARLMDAAYTVFARDGINAASIEVICETAGFTRGAFYSNFGSKEELFLALADQLKRRHLDALEGAVQSLDPGEFESGVVPRDAIAHVLGAVEIDDPDRARQWTVLQTELELLAMRDARVAELVATHDDAVRHELSEVIARILDRLGLRFTTDPGTALDLLITAQGAGARAAATTHPAPGEAASPAGVPTGLSALVELLVTTKN